jgi:hypothetical protein
VRAQACRPPLDVAAQAVLERGGGRWVGVVLEARSRQPELARAFREGRRQLRHGQPPCLDELGSRRREALGPRRDRVEWSDTELYTAQRRVALRQRRKVVLRHAGACRQQAREHPVEIRPSCCRPTLDDRETVGGEDERRQLAAQ